VLACIDSFIAGGAFPHAQPDVSFVCTETNPYKGAQRFKGALVVGSARKATPAMREWSRLGWFEMAAFAVIQGRCCAAPPVLAGPKVVARCQLDAALLQLGGAAKQAGGMEDAIKAYVAAISCIGDLGAVQIFGQERGLLGGWERNAFDKLFGFSKP